MKKLIFVFVLLVAVLIFSWWAKSVNFNPLSLASAFPQVKGASTTATVEPTKTTPTPIPVEIIITITPNGFVPDALMITSNTKITWVNKSGTTASIASDPENAFTDLNLGDLWENSSVSLTFTKPGRYHYLNSKNPLQKGTLIVK